MSRKKSKQVIFDKHYTNAIKALRTCRHLFMDMQDDATVPGECYGYISQCLNYTKDIKELLIRCISEETDAFNQREKSQDKEGN